MERLKMAWLTLCLALLVGCDSNVVVGAIDGGSGDGDADADSDADGDGDACEGTCTVVGGTHCNGDVVETCTERADGCVQWVQSEDCSSRDRVCRQVAGDTVCRVCDRGVLRRSEGYRIADRASMDGLVGYTVVTTGLDLTMTDLADVDGLECLQEIRGDLTIVANEHLTDLDGLGGLREVWGSLEIGGYGQCKSPCKNDNTSLRNIDGLRGLTSLGGHLSIIGNSALISLEGLGGLAEVPGAVTIADNAGLTKLDGLGGITSIGMEQGHEAGDLWIEQNPVLESLDGLAAVTAIGDALWVDANARLPTCAAISLRDRLLAVGWSGFVHIEGNDDAGLCE